MEVTKGNKNAYIATAWATISDISGTGTSVAESAAIGIVIPDTPFTDMIIELETVLNMTGGTGYVVGWIKISGTGNLLTNDGADSTFYSNNTFTNTTKIMQSGKSFKIKPLVYPLSNSGGSLLYLYLRCKGTAADTAWTATNIRARILYSPL